MYMRIRVRNMVVDNTRAHNRPDSCYRARVFMGFIDISICVVFTTLKNSILNE